MKPLIVLHLLNNFSFRTNAEGRAPMDGLTDDDVIATIAQELDIDPAAAGEVLAAMLGVLTEALADNRRVILKGFGTFEVKSVKGDFGHRTRTHRRRMVLLPTTRQPTFKAGSQLRRAVHDDETEIANPEEGTQG